MAAHRVLLALVAALVGLVSVNSARADEVKVNLTRDTSKRLTHRGLATETHTGAERYDGDKRNWSTGNARHTIEDLKKESRDRDRDRDDEWLNNRHDYGSRALRDLTPTQAIPALTPTPEPASFALFGTGLLGIGIWIRKRLFA